MVIIVELQEILRSILAQFQSIFTWSYIVGGIIALVLVKIFWKAIEKALEFIWRPLKGIWKYIKNYTVRFYVT